MKLQPGDIYEGAITSLGYEGSLSRWIVISPFGKIHCHSIDDPFDLHCMPIGIAQNAVADHRLHLVEQSPHHPVMELQREKERAGISDSHLGLRGEQLNRMLALIRRSAETEEAYLPYAVGEVLSFVKIHQNDEVRAQVYEMIRDLLSSCADLPGPIPTHLMSIQPNHPSPGVQDTP